ncbi:MAG: hypothetical protein AABY02_04210, partial [Nanoarchaeota archaeon]
MLCNANKSRLINFHQKVLEFVWDFWMLKNAIISILDIKSARKLYMTLPPHPKGLPAGKSAYG